MCERTNTGLMQVFEVEAKIVENSHTKTLRFNGGLEGAMPGQFVMVWLPGVGEKPFSIAAAAPLALTISDVGPVSHALNEIGVGEKVWIRGPFGQGYRLIGKRHLLVGGGYGAAPLAFLAEEALKQGHQVGVCLGAKTEEDLLMESKLSGMGCLMRVATNDGSKGLKGLVTEQVEKAILEDKPDCLYACGPTGMLLALADICKQHNLPCQLSFEGLIRCGVGLCGSCELGEDLCERVGLPGGWLACHDGPVAFFGISD